MKEVLDRIEVKLDKRIAEGDRRFKLMWWAGMILSIPSGIYVFWMALK